MNDLPRLRIARAEEASSRAVIQQKRQPDGCCCAFGDRLLAPMPVEVRGRVSGIWGIDLDPNVFQLGGELNRQHVQCGFGGAIADEPVCAD